MEYVLKTVDYDCSTTLLVTPFILIVLIGSIKVTPFAGNDSPVPSNFNQTIISWSTCDLTGIGNVTNIFCII